MDKEPRSLGKDSADGLTAPVNSPSDKDVALLMQHLLTQMQTRFEQMSTTVLSKIDEMTNRLEDIEKTVAGLAQQTGLEIPSALMKPVTQQDNNLTTNEPKTT